MNHEKAEKRTDTTLRAVCLPTSLWSPRTDPRPSFTYIDVSAVDRSSCAIRNAAEVKTAAAPSRARKLVRKGDVIFATVRPRLKRVALIDAVFDNQVASTAFCVVRPDPSKANARYIYYLLRTDFMNAEIARFESGASYPAVTDKHVLDRPISLPSLDVQSRLARALHTVQQAMEIEERLLLALRELKHSTLRRLFGHGLRNEDQKESPIGLIPKSWDVAPLGRHLTRAQYGLSVRGQDSGRVPILRMNCQEDGAVVFRDLQYIDLDDETLAAFRVEEGDLLFNRTNSFELVGRTAIFRGKREVVFASYLIRLTPNPASVDPEFLNYYLGQPSVQATLKTLASRGVSQANISASKLKDFLIPVAPLADQRAVTDALQRIDRALSIHERKFVTLQELFKRLLHELMSGDLPVANLDRFPTEVTLG